VLPCYLALVQEALAENLVLKLHLFYVVFFLLGAYVEVLSVLKL
jgi:hypothetical protein